MRLAASLPGDELEKSTGIGAVSTRAITIDAPPEAVWPWLVQMGSGRAGFYTHEWVERLLLISYADGHSSTRIHPEWQELHVGDRVPYSRVNTVPWCSSILRAPSGRVSTSSFDRSMAGDGPDSSPGRGADGSNRSPAGADRLAARLATRSADRSRPRRAAPPLHGGRDAQGCQGAGRGLVSSCLTAGATPRTHQLTGPIPSHAPTLLGRSLRSTARARATRLATPILLKTLRRCVSTVFWLRNSCDGDLVVRLAIDDEPRDLELTFRQKIRCRPPGYYGAATVDAVCGRASLALAPRSRGSATRRRHRGPLPRVEVLLRPGRSRPPPPGLARRACATAPLRWGLRPPQQPWPKRTANGRRTGSCDAARGLHGVNEHARRQGCRCRSPHGGHPRVDRCHGLHPLQPWRDAVPAQRARLRRPRRRICGRGPGTDPVGPAI